MYKMGMIGLLLASLWACDREQPIETRIKENPSTFCNPLNLDYRFMKETVFGKQRIRQWFVIRTSSCCLRLSRPVTGILRTFIHGRMW